MNSSTEQGLITGFNLPTLSPSHKLHQSLISTLRQQSLLAVESPTKPAWNASFFGLETATLFKTSSPVEQTQILQLASQNLLEAAYSLKKAGVGYMAKMALLAQTLEERMLYVLLGADETSHLVQLKPLVTQEPNGAKNDSFFTWLEQLSHETERVVLLFVVQIVLEGWGIRHYQTLSRHCSSPVLCELLNSFVKSESIHHRAGLALYAQAELSAQNREDIVAALTVLLRRVQAGPQRLIRAIATVKGDLSTHQTTTLLQELNVEKQVGERLELLRSLITPVASDIADALEEKGLFSPFPLSPYPAHE